MPQRVAITLVRWSLVTCCLAAASASTADARNPAAKRRAAWHSAAEHELALTQTANTLERGRAALERERKSLDWASELLEQRGRESLRKLDAYAQDQVEREVQAGLRARELYKLSRGGGMLELMFEEGSNGRLAPAERAARAQTLRGLIDHDLELLRVHTDAKTHAADELLTATRELNALAVLDSVARMQAEAIASTGAKLKPEIAAVHGQRKKLQNQVRRRRSRADRKLLKAVARERRDLVRHRGLDLLEDDGLVRPVRGRVVGRYGEYRDRLLKVPMHRNGVELAADENDEVRAIATGEVAMVGALPGFERVVVIDHGGGYLSLTARLLSVDVREGDTIEGGDVLGRVGAKAVDDGLGPTVYLEIRHGQRPIDPARYLKRRRRR